MINVKAVKFSKCRTCGQIQYPPRVLCSTCLSDDLVWEEIEATGQVLATTDVHVSPERDPEREPPARIGLIKLDAGPVVYSFLEAEVDVEDVVTVCSEQNNQGQNIFKAGRLS